MLKQSLYFSGIGEAENWPVGASSSHQEEEDRQEEYVRRDGLLPVQIGQICNHRYHVVGKLGQGAYSTVWQCWDRKEKRLVAMKVVKSAKKYTASALAEIKMLKYLRTSAPDHEDRKRIVQLLDNFQINGVNGVRKLMICSH